MLKLVVQDGIVRLPESQQIGYEGCCPKTGCEPIPRVSFVGDLAMVFAGSAVRTGNKA